MLEAKPRIAVILKDPSFELDARLCASALGIDARDAEAGDGIEHQLIFAEQGVYLLSGQGKRVNRVMVDFCAGDVAHRRKYGGGKGQMIAKAVGVSAKFRPHVFDATAGLGKDAFVLASLGCQLTLMERSPIAFALLRDGLLRARRHAVEHDVELLAILDRMNLIEGDSVAYLAAQRGISADVVYLDPMFPERRKNAAVKKEMRAFHAIVGPDLDDPELLNQALAHAQYRVVVKRPRLAPTIAGVQPTYCLAGKSSRYDIFALKSIIKQ